MIRIISTIVLMLLFNQNESGAQTIARNHCDSNILSKQEYEKCISDSIYDQDIIVRSNYVIFLKTNLLPAFRTQRQLLVINDEIKIQLKRLKFIYDSSLDYRIQAMTGDMDRNQKYMQPKAYISSLLSLQVFKFYPDVYAVLLNEIHLAIKPKSSPEQMSHIENLITHISSLLRNDQKTAIKMIVTDLAKQRKKFSNSPYQDIFQGAIEDAEREKYNIINYLLWME